MLFSLFLSLFHTVHAEEVMWDGHYRTQAHLYKSLSLSQSNSNAIDSIAYANHWMNLRPTWQISNKVSLHAQMDMLYFQNFGTTPITYIDPAWSNASLSFSDSVRSPGNEINISRAWAEVNSDIGLIRFGRMPVHWGSGMVFNAGNKPTQFVGDTADRIQYSKQFAPVFVLAAIESRNSGYVSTGNNSIAGTLSLYYANERISGGLYNVIAKETNTDGTATKFTQLTTDGYFGADFGALDVQAELALQYGSGDLPNGLDEITQLAFGGTLDAQLKMEEIQVGLQAGYASGDSDLNDKKYKQFVFDRNFDISLMLFDQVMPTLAPINPTASNGGLELSAARVGNGISNALYAQPRVSYQLTPTFRPEFRALFARTVALPDSEAGNTNYGVELNANLYYQPLEKFELRGQLGYLFLGNYLTKYNNVDFGGGFDTNPYGMELNAIVHF